MMNEKVKKVQQVSEKIIELYPFLTKKERNDFEKKSDAILNRVKKDSISVFDSITKILLILENEHADIRKYNKASSAQINKAKLRKMPKIRIKNRILIAVIPSWAQWLGPIDKQLINYFKDNNHKYDSILIDVRKNDGGNSILAFNFASIFFNKQVIAGRIVIKNLEGELKSKSFRNQPNKEIFIDKPIAILISKKCFSSNELFLSLFKTTGRATLIGETTRGGSANPFSMEVFISGKKYVVRVPTWRFFLRGKRQPIEKTKIKPDIEYTKRDIQSFSEKWLRVNSGPVKF
jgi:C-terminal processing protease CtpA/Prc